MMEALPRPLLALTALLLLARIATGLHESGRGAESSAGLSWRSAAAALEESAETGRPVLYAFSATWCGPCRIQERQVFSNPEHGSFIESAFVPVKVEDGSDHDGLEREERRELRERFDITSFPTLVVVDGEQVLGRQVGHPGCEPTLAFLKARLEEDPADGSH